MEDKDLTLEDMVKVYDFLKLVNELDLSIQKNIDNIKEYNSDPDEESDKQVSDITWKRAVVIVDKLFTVKSLQLLFPAILPYCNGSVDIYWKKGGVDLLINVPAAENKLPSFSGDYDKSNEIRGVLSDLNYLVLRTWISNVTKIELGKMKAND